MVPLIPVPEKVPTSPAPAGMDPETGIGVAERVLVSPAHISAEEDEMARLLFCRTFTVMEEEPPARQFPSRMSTLVTSVKLGTMTTEACPALQSGPLESLKAKGLVVEVPWKADIRVSTAEPQVLTV